MTLPMRDRPGIPESYGIATGEEGMLEWFSVDAALAATSHYWISTVRANGEPHLIPIWGGWAHNRLHIEGGDDTLWFRNLMRSPRVAVGCDHEGMQIILYGMASYGPVDGFEAVADNYEAKYPYRPEAKDMWEIAPSTVLAWVTATVNDFATSPTRFRFEEAR